MIYSPSKASDMRWRLELLNQMENDMLNNRPTTARKIGEMTKLLDERIKTHDYTEDDSRVARIKKLLKGTLFDQP